MSLIEEFQGFRRILCVCPCCGDIVRVSDLQLSPKGVVPRTWLDDYDKSTQKLLDAEAKFDEHEEKIREKSREKGRKEAKKVFNLAISPAFRALGLDAYDVKPILNPVDFVVFDGMNDDKVREVLFLSKKTNANALNLIRSQVKDVVVKKKYDWQVARIADNGKIEFE